MIEDAQQSNFEVFRDCLANPLISVAAIKPSKITKKRKGTGRKNAIKPVATVREPENDAEELSDFIDYIASSVFINLSVELRSLTYSNYINDSNLQEIYSLPLTTTTTAEIFNTLDPSTAETLHTYSILPTSTSLSEFLTPVLTAYLTTLTTAPPPPSATRALATACEICDRDWVPLTYHHLIPRFVHAKVLKRGWHTEDKLDSVAWLCRACHSFVHRVAGHEELAREYYTVELLLERDDVLAFAKWVGKVRWKSR